MVHRLHLAVIHLPVVHLAMVHLLRVSHLALLVVGVSLLTCHRGGYQQGCHQGHGQNTATEGFALHEFAH
ncbi:hypothetical protein D3C80_1945970 [compost metagenome]